MTVEDGDQNVFDPALREQAEADCLAMRQTIDNRPADQLDLAQTKDFLLSSATIDCVADTSLGLPWTTEQMQSQLCTSIQEKVNIERTDIYCAQHLLQQLSIPKTQIEQLGVQTDAVPAVQQIVDQYAMYETEMSKSQASLVHWDDGSCDLEALDVLELQVDCAAYTFSETTVRT